MHDNNVRAKRSHLGYIVEVGAFEGRSGSEKEREPEERRLVLGVAAYIACHHPAMTRGGEKLRFFAKTVSPVPLFPGTCVL